MKIYFYLLDSIEVWMYYIKAQRKSYSFETIVSSFQVEYLYHFMDLANYV